MSQSSQEAAESDDFDRIIAALNQYHVDFMIIGGWAVVYHGHVRMTEDLDIYIRPTEDNAKKAVAALEASILYPDFPASILTRRGRDVKPAPLARSRSTLFLERT